MKVILLKIAIAVLNTLKAISKSNKSSAELLNLLNDYTELPKNKILLLTKNLLESESEIEKSTKILKDIIHNIKEGS